jgi:hypothetical protein
MFERLESHALWLPATNVSGDDIPPMAPVEITLMQYYPDTTSSETIALAGPRRHIVCHVQRPSEDNCRSIGVNGITPLYGPNSLGWPGMPSGGQLGVIAVSGDVLVDVGDDALFVTPGMVLGTTAASFALQEGQGMYAYGLSRGRIHLVSLARAVPAAEYKPFCRFALSEALTTSDESATAVIGDQWGYGTYTFTVSDEIVVMNLQDHTGSAYVFSGDVDDIGIASYDPEDDTWHILQMECA